MSAEATTERVSEEQTQVVEEQKAATTATTQESDPGDADLGWSEEQKTYIESLRKENAKYRTKSKELETNYNGLNDKFSKIESGLRGLFGEEGEELSPEDQISALSQQNESLVINSALTEAALEYGIGKEDYSYFKYLVTERLGELEDGEELTEEDLDGLASAARRGKAAASTSVEGGGTPPPESESGITLEAFALMGINERSSLFAKNEALYKQLLAQERGSKALK